MTASAIPVRLYGVGGKPGAGKDEFADRLVVAHGWTKTNMSTPIDDLAQIENPIIDAWIEDDEARIAAAPALLRPLVRLFAAKTVKLLRYNDLRNLVGFTDAKRHPEFRGHLQRLGSGAREVIDKSVWVDAAAVEIDRLLADGKSVVLSGVRTIPEVELINSRGGVCVWVNRPGVDASGDGTHSIENMVSGDDFDEVLVNDGTLQDLRVKVDSYSTRKADRA